MASKLPTKYRSEEAVKKALRIDSFRNLSKDKIMEFASMIPYVDKEVAIAIINQFPTFADFGKTVVSCYMDKCDALLESNNESQRAVINGYQTILDALSKRMDAENLTTKERKSITEDMISVADKIADADARNKKFLDKMGSKLLIGVVAVVAVVGGALGISSKFGGGGDLPQIAKDDDDDYTV